MEGLASPHPGGETRPTPDPTTLTTEALLREVSHVREIMNERDQRYQNQFNAQDAITVQAISSAKEAVLKAEVAANERFKTLEAQLKADYAGFSKESLARFDANKSGATAIRDELYEKINTLDRLLTEKIDGLKERLGRNDGKTIGAAAVWGIVGTLVGVGVAIAEAIILAFHK